VDGRDRYDDICDALTAWHDDVRRSKVFGMPCLKKSGRVIAGFPRRGSGMVFKLTDPDAHARALALPGAHLFDPAAQPPVRASGPVEGVRGNREVPSTPAGGRQPFKQWVVVPPDQAAEWEALAMDALRAPLAGDGSRPAKPGSADA
jgi:hypothetical protein